MTEKYKIVHDREACIGCGACASVCPSFWEMDDEGKSKLKGEVKQTEEGEVLEPISNDFDCNHEAAESCPVNCIHIFDLDGEEEKKLI